MKQDRQAVANDRQQNRRNIFTFLTDERDTSSLECFVQQRKCARFGHEAGHTTPFSEILGVQPVLRMAASGKGRITSGLKAANTARGSHFAFREFPPLNPAHGYTLLGSAFGFTAGAPTAPN